MKKYKINWYIAFCVLSILIVFYLSFRWYVTKDLIGIVETKTHVLGVQEPGIIKNILVFLGDRVEKGQVLVKLDTKDLNDEIIELNDELAVIKKLKGAQQEHFTLQFKQMELQIENEVSDLTERYSLLEYKNTELAGLNSEIDRLEKAENAGLGHSRDFADLILKRDALNSYLREQSKELKLQTEKLNKTNKSRKALDNADSDSIVQFMLLKPMERARELYRRLAIARHRIQLRTIIAPVEGYIVELLASPGDVVQEFMPILTVEEAIPKYLTVYLPEKSHLRPIIGANVKIHSERSRKFNSTGFVKFVHPGFSITPERLSFRGQIFWARKIRVDLEKGHSLLPGEIVYARIEKYLENGNYFSSKVQASETTSVGYGRIQNPSIIEMNVPENLWARTRFEPSGITWLEDIQKYIIISDDTGIKDKKNDHAPYLFLMDENGTIESDPIPLVGVNKINDLEAIAPSENSNFYLVSSQNISKRGKRPASRQMIYKVTKQGRTFKVQEKVAFLSLLHSSYSTTQLKQLGLKKFEKDNHPELNIEGAAWYEGALYLGLKQPNSNKGAIIWKLNNPDQIFSGNKLAPDQLSIYGHINLGEHKGRKASISDLSFDHNGRLWVLSTIPGAADKDQLGGLHRIDQFVNDRLEAVHFFSFPEKKPEGICFQNNNNLIIVFDADNKTPSFVSVAVEDL